MAQLDYSFEMAKGQPGLKVDIGFSDVLTYRAFEDIPFGFGMTQGVRDKDGRLPSANVAVLTFDADFVTGNEIDLDVNGESIDTVPFDTDHETTLENLAAEIDDLDDITASVTGAREITIISSVGDVLVENVSVTGGASQADSSVEYSTDHDFIGVSLRTHRIEQNLEGEAFYHEKDVVNVLTRGRVYVTVENDVKVGDPVYLRHTDGTSDELRGQFRSNDASGDAFLIERARFVRDASAGELVVLEVNLP